MGEQCILGDRTYIGGESYEKLRAVRPWDHLRCCLKDSVSVMNSEAEYQTVQHPGLEGCAKDDYKQATVTSTLFFVDNQTSIPHSCSTLISQLQESVMYGMHSEICQTST